MAINKHLKFDIIQIPLDLYEHRSQNKIEAIVLHSIGTEIQNIISTFKSFGVSAHFFVPQITTDELSKFLHIPSDVKILHPNKIPVIEFVNPKYKAWHAGVSAWKELAFNQSLNDCSIGIEFHCPGYDAMNYFCKFSKAQSIVGTQLIRYLKYTYSIKQENIVAHSTVAVGRKTDPGPLFFWERLRKHNLAASVSDEIINIVKNSDDIAAIQKILYDSGFVLCPQTGVLDSQTKACIQAFYWQFL